MRYARMAAVGLCSLVLTVGALAQARSDASAAVAKTSEVLGLVPADAMGVLVVNNVKSATDNLNQFLSDIGVPVGNTLEMLLSQLEIAEDGFRAEGGFAAAMLDPSQFGMDLAAKIQAQMTGEGDDDDEDFVPPVAVYVPGKLKAMLANHEVSKGTGTKHQVVDLGGVEMYVTEIKGYVVFSPLPKVLDAVAASKKSITTVMTKEQSDAVLSNDLVAYVNMKVAGPLLSKVLEAAQQAQMEELDEGEAFQKIIGRINNKNMQSLREMVEQSDSALMGVKFVKEGLLTEWCVAFTKGSDAAKANAELKPLGKGKELDRLPAKNYVIAMDGMCPRGEQADKAREEFLSMLFSDDVLGMLNDGDKGKLKGIVNALATQVTRGQFVLGGSSGEGAFAATAVLIVQDSAAFTKAMKDAVALMNKFINDAIVAQFGKEAAAEVNVGLVYKAAASKQGTVNVDQIGVVLPEGAMNPMIQAMLTQAIGDSDVRVLLACPDKTTVVMTLGGSTKQMTEALKTATKGGGLDISKVKVSGLKYMPENRNDLAVIHLANLVKNISAVAGGMVPELKADAPIMIASAATGNQNRCAIFVPSAAIQEVVQVVGQMMMGGGPGGFGDDDDDDWDDEEDEDDED